MALTWPRLTSRRERAGGLRARGFVGRYAALLGKELRLQAPTLLFSGMFVTAWLVSQAFGRVLPESWAAVTAGFAVFHGMVVALLAGALVGAEERQMGTLVSQFQLPMAVWRQWLIKVVVALTVGLVLSVGLPLTLGAILPVPGREAFHSLARNIDAFAASAVLLGVAGILASSVATSGLRAAIAAAMLAAGLAAIAVTILQVLAVGIQLWRPVGLASPVAVTIAAWFGRTIPFAVAALALWFAFGNIRYLDRGPRQLARQCVSLVGAWVGCYLLSIVVVRALW